MKNVTLIKMIIAALLLIVVTVLITLTLTKELNVPQSEILVSDEDQISSKEPAGGSGYVDQNLTRETLELPADSHLKRKKKKDQNLAHISVIDNVNGNANIGLEIINQKMTRDEIQLSEQSTIDEADPIYSKKMSREDIRISELSIPQNAEENER
jgi:hypothetical protein